MNCLLLTLCTSAMLSSLIPGLFNTGIDPAGNLVSPGQLDPHYRIVRSADPLFQSADVRVVSLGSPGFNVWLPNSETSQWVSLDGLSNPGNFGGLYTYQTSFSMNGFDHTTGRLKVKIASDNQVTYLLLNGVSAAIPNIGFSQFSEVLIDRGFRPGLNVLTIEVFNEVQGGSPVNRNPTALRLEVEGIASLGVNNPVGNLVKNISTGIDDASGEKLGSGILDTDYQAQRDATLSFTPVARSQDIDLLWLDDSASASSRWITLDSLIPRAISPNGLYSFTTNIDLTGYIASSAYIHDLRLASDNFPIEVFINGHSAFTEGFSNREYSSLLALGDVGLGLFKDGINTVEFVFQNFNTVENPNVASPMGLRVEGAVYASAVPEASPIVLLTGLFATAGLARRGRM